MEKKSNGYIKPVQMLKALVFSYVVTIILLLILTFLLYKFGLNEQVVEMGICVVYLLSAFSGGVMAGKLAGSRRFVWGILSGILYFIFLLLVSVGVYRTLQGGMQMLIAFGLSVFGGMLGGMIS
ncbi:MAG: TIGR04086 family membrane protein [Bariatricus sp.]|nr:TIGR04086 family membrane protein [Bariatricus sp.]